jgi:hypothetical protein
MHLYGLTNKPPRHPKRTANTLPPLQTTLSCHSHYTPMQGKPRATHNSPQHNYHTNVRGTDLADAAAELVFTSFDDIPWHPKLNVTVAKQAERPPFYVMYINKPLASPIRLATKLHSTMVRPLCWTILEKKRQCIHALTKPSDQL